MDIEAYLPDIIIIDTATLGEKQVKFLKKLNQTTRFTHIPKIFLTIKGLTVDRIDGYNSGCDAYVSKPFDPEELEAIINNLIKKSKNRLSWIINTLIKIKRIRINFLEKTNFSQIKQIKITSQETEVLKKVSQNKSNLEIAEELKTTKRNIERHISRLLNKTNMNTRSELKQLN